MKHLYGTYNKLNLIHKNYTDRKIMDLSNASYPAQIKNSYERFR